MAKATPLVSCICITENRVPYLERAYKCYRAQTYINIELIVVCMKDDLATLNFLEHVSALDPSVKVIAIERTERGSLGRLRNTAIDKADGDYICVWDDDDIYHIQRIKKSMDAIQLSNKPAVALSNVVVHDVINGEIYSSTRRSWEQTLLCNKQFLKENGISYADLNRYEDTPLIEKLWRHIFLLSDPSLYIYSFHKSNTSDAAHFQNFLAAGIKLPDSHRQLVNKISNQELTNEQAAREMENEKLLKSYQLLPSDIPVYWKSFRFSETSN